MSTSPAAPLTDALDDLTDAARGAGLDPSQARAEGEALAAAVAEHMKGSFARWSEQTGREVSAEAFMEAAMAGRRYRTSPTPLASQLLGGQRATADPYLDALTGVAAAAATLGVPDERTAGIVMMASAAQRGAAPAAPTTAPTPAAPGVREPAPGVLDGVGARVMQQLHALQRGVERSAGELGRTASNLDLAQVDAGVPGAFDLTGTDSNQPSQPTQPTQPAPPTQAAPADTAPAEADQPAEPEEEPRSVEELLAELDELVGLETVKGEIHRQAAVLRVEGLRKEAGLAAPTITRHMIFNGNPGTGKTTVARLVAGIYRALGLLSQGQLVEVDRSELVAGYLGQTAMKTAEVVGKAKGGVLFIDEAYALAGDQYGQEAVDTLVKEMEDNRDDLVVIVAGYPAPMEVFVAQNPGLESRFRTTIDFVDYTDEELVAIFEVMLTGAEYDAGPEVLERLAAKLATVQRGPSFGNARYVRNLLEAAIGRHAWRLREVEEPTIEQLRTLEPDDLDIALEPPADATGDEPAVELEETFGDGTGEQPGSAPEAPELPAGQSEQPEQDTQEDR